MGLFTKFKMCCSSDYTAIAESGNACALKLVNHFNAETSDIASNRLMSFCNRAVNVEVFCDVLMLMCHKGLCVSYFGLFFYHTL